MKILVVNFLIIVVHMAVISPLFAKDKKADMNAAFGIGGSYAYFDVQSKRSESDWKSGTGYGGGFFFGKMFGNTLGIHSGLSVNRFAIELVDSETSTDETTGVETTTEMKMDVVTWSINMPLYMVLSFNTRVFSFNLLFGPSLMYLFNSEVRATDGSGNTVSEDVLRYLVTIQAGMGAGINFKFRIGTFTDFYVGFVAQYYFTKLIKGDGSDYSNLYAGRVISGVMFRTDLFPIVKSKDE